MYNLTHVNAHFTYYNHLFCSNPCLSFFNFFQLFQWQAFFLALPRVEKNLRIRQLISFIIILDALMKRFPAFFCRNSRVNDEHSFQDLGNSFQMTWLVLSSFFQANYNNLLLEKQSLPAARLPFFILKVPYFPLLNRPQSRSHFLGNYIANKDEDSIKIPFSCSIVFLFQMRDNYSARNHRRLKNNLSELKKKHIVFRSRLPRMYQRV